MKNKIKTILLCVAVSTIVSSIAGFVIIRCFPQYLYYHIYDEHSSSLADEKLEILSDAEYLENFVPTCQYLKSIAIKPAYDELKEETMIQYKLTDGEGNDVVKGAILLPKVMNTEYIVLKIEKGVIPGDTYSLLFNVEGSESVEILCSKEQIGPREHVSFCKDGVKQEINIFAKYTYGTYSKKLLLLWFVMFFSVSFMICESIISFKIKKAENIDKIA